MRIIMRIDFVYQTQRPLSCMKRALENVIGNGLAIRI